MAHELYLNKHTQGFQEQLQTDFKQMKKQEKVLNKDVEDIKKSQVKILELKRITEAKKEKAP